MRKSILSFVMCMICLCTFGQINENPNGTIVEFSLCPFDPSLGGGSIPKSPITPPTASIDGHTLYIYDVTSPLALTVVDENQQVIYTAYVPTGNTTLVLPATLTGTFELQLYPGGDYYFAAEITL